MDGGNEGVEEGEEEADEKGLTVPTASSWKGGPLSVGWGLSAESLLLLTNSGVPVENRTHEDMVQLISPLHKIIIEQKLTDNGRRAFARASAGA
ncbi:hypothetical protein EYF80_001129 [Liparis tanakae]|uniref:Uncharacterized protein n=1 Tax=Liparis tanakae TaxID=230148 RepID=A0A4Z2JFN9_9TELE|nr:hypothetical protein EYF80_001129 [Liparis tanakae]